MTTRKAVSAATMVVLIALLVAGAWFGWQTMSAPLPGEEDEPARVAQPKCEEDFERGDIIRRPDVTVSVYNAGSRSGLADQTLSELSARGFVRGEAGNAPTRLEEVQFVRVLARADGDPAAELVALQFGDDTFIQQVRRDLGPGVEVIVGDNFAGLVNAPNQVKARRSSANC